MSWPAPSGPPPSLAMPPVQLPWASRERSKWAPPPINRNRRTSVRKAKYAAAMVAGVVVVDLAKRILNAIPVLGLFTKPILDLFPTILLGPALGAAAYYGHEQGDPLAARHVVAEKAQVVKREVDTVVRDLSEEVRARNAALARQMEGSQALVERTARVAAESVAEMERTVVPAMEQGFRTIEVKARQAFEDPNRPPR
ncbi:hypothetical protein HYH03_018818 [Edaphochlamys debaryana]|uniref:Uncharacterized protein n=1 Tax=Edaphochlamys debaryana TaxID=47281 RepID=A0A835XF57_9CHLO|nr:hypothetical protein HYH03_018818 [Edaphochlamys debaryana]|eukprot:KAG2482234.1 hypothetical protein HYH03_018818 [Edaphochlamys debaryana]